MDSKSGSSKSEINTESIYSKICTEFPNDIIKESLRLKFKDTKAKITEEAVELMKEITRVLVVESAIRSANLAKMQDSTVISLNNVETMLLQLMLDFP